MLRHYNDVRNQRDLDNVRFRTKALLLMAIRGPVPAPILAESAKPQGACHFEVVKPHRVLIQYRYAT
jgi:hypothetical protein